MDRRARDAHPWLEQYTNVRTGGGSRGAGFGRLQQFEERRAGGKQCTHSGLDKRRSWCLNSCGGCVECARTGCIE